MENEIKRFYIFEGQKVGIAYSDDVPADKVLLLCGTRAVVPLHVLESLGLESLRTDTDTHIDDDFDLGEEIDCGTVINPENEQTLVRVINAKTDIEDDKERQQYGVITSDHHHWTSEARRMVDKIIGASDTSCLNELRSQWENAITLLGPKDWDVLSFDDLLEACGN